MLSLMMTCISLGGLGLLYPSVQQIWSSILSPMLIAVLACGIWFILKRIDFRLCCVSFGLGVLFAGLFAVGYEIQIVASTAEEGSLKSIFIRMCYVISLFWMASSALFYLFDRCVSKNLPADSAKALSKISWKVIFFFGWAVLLLVYLFGLSGVFPGLYSYDALSQLTIYYENLDASHPVLHTLFLGGCFDVGVRIFGSATVGIFIYSIVQLTLMSLTFSWFVARLSHYLPSWLCVIFLLFFAFVPYHALLAVSTTKDALFAASLLLVLLELFECAVDTQEYVRKKSSLIRLGGAVLLFLLLRNNALYAGIIFLPFFIAFAVSKRVVGRLLCAVGSACLVYGVIVTVGYGALQVEKGNIREALSIPLQQLSGTAVMRPEVFTDEQMEELTRLIPDYKNYLSGISDPVKLNSNCTGNETALLNLYGDIGLKAPLSYTYIFLRMTYAYWYPDMDFQDKEAFHPYLYSENVFQTTYGGLPVEYRVYNTFAADVFSMFDDTDPAFQDIPLVSLLFSPGFALWLMLCAAGYALYRRAYMLLLPSALIVAYLLTLLLGPVAMIRYAYPLMATMPLYITIIAVSARGVKRNNPVN